MIRGLETPINMKTLALSLISALAFAQAPQYPVLPGGGGGGAVSSVFGRTGAVAAATNDYSVGQISGNIVQTYNGRTGTVVPAVGDSAMSISAPSGAPNYNVVLGDKGKILATTNAPVIRFPTVASVGAGFYFYVYQDPSVGASVQITDGALIDGIGGGSFFLPAYITSLFITDGTNWFTQGYLPPMIVATASTNGTLGIPNAATAGQQDLPLMGGLSTSTLGNYFTSTVGRFAAKTAAQTVLTKTSTVATDETYLISANVNVTTATAHSFTVTATYTDETNTSRTLTLPFVALAGTTLTTITNVTGAGPYEGVPVHIRCKANTTITIASVGTFTTVTYNIEAHIRHLQ